MTRILIASNDIILLNTISIFMNMEYCDVKLCSEPGNVYNKIESFQPDVVFLDDDLQIETNKSVCNRIKLNPSTSHMKVIIYCNTPTKSISDCLPDDYFLTPFSLSDLVKKINKQVMFMHNQKLVRA